MSIDPNENRAEEWVLARMDADLDADPGIADAVQEITRALPIIPSGGRTEQLVRPQVVRAESLRDRARIWAPAIAGTAGPIVLLTDPFGLPLTGPLMAYGFAWAGFGWWLAAGRPGPRDTAVLLFRLTAAACRWLAVAAVAVAGLSVKTARLIAALVRRARPAMPQGAQA